MQQINQENRAFLEGDQYTQSLDLLSWDYCIIDANSKQLNNFCGFWGLNRQYFTCYANASIFSYSLSSKDGLLIVINIISDINCWFTRKNNKTKKPFSYYTTYIKINSGGWRDGSTIKNTDCSSKGLGFHSQNLHRSTELSVNCSSKGSNALFWTPYALHTSDTQTYMETKHSYTIQIIELSINEKTKRLVEYR